MHAGRILYRNTRRLWSNHKTTSITVVAICGFSIPVGIHFTLWRRAATLWTDHNNSVMGTISIVALILAIVAEWRLESIKKSVSTRYVGEFPDHVGKITTAIENASVRVDALADCVDYGSFFRPKEFESVASAIEATAKRLPVRLLICGNTQPISRASAWACRPFPDRIKDTDFGDTLLRYVSTLRNEKGRFRKFLQSAIDANPSYYNCLLEFLNSEEFKSDGEEPLNKLLLLRHAWFVDRFGDADIKKHCESTDVFLWIIDGVEAVFLFTYPAADALAFFTRDPSLIRVLTGMFNTRWKNASVYEESEPLNSNHRPSASCRPVSRLVAAIAIMKP